MFPNEITLFSGNNTKIDYHKVIETNKKLQRLILQQKKLTKHMNELEWIEHALIFLEGTLRKYLSAKNLLNTLN